MGREDMFDDGVCPVVLMVRMKSLMRSLMRSMRGCQSLSRRVELRLGTRRIWRGRRRTSFLHVVMERTQSLRPVGRAC